MSSRTTSIGGVISLLGAFLASALVLGLLAAGLVMPAVGATGALARSGVDVFNELPSEFTTDPLAQTSRILAADGSVIATPQEQNRTIVPLSKVAPIMREAQVAIEDHRFYEHGGVDLQGVLRAAISNIRSGATTSGASSLTQQYVKISLQYSALNSGNKQAAAAAVKKDYMRKLKELKYAITLEKKLTKDQILEGYLNLVYYGDRAYGVEAASLHYFSVHADKLSLSQAALLAGLTQNPGTTDPVNFPKKAVARRNVVLDRMHELGRITDKQWTDAKKRTLKQDMRVQQPKSTCLASPYPYWCDFIVNYALAMPELGKTVEERKRMLYRGGVTIHDHSRPAGAAGHAAGAHQEGADRRPVPRRRRRLRHGSLRPARCSPSPRTRPTPWTRSRRGKTGINWALDQRWGGSGGFQFGSTAKAFALVTAMESGMTLRASVNAKAAGDGHMAAYQPEGLPWRLRTGRPVERRQRHVLSRRQHQPHEGDRAVDQHGLRRARRAARRLQGARHHAPPRPAPVRRAAGRQVCAAVHPRRLRRLPAGSGAGLRRPRRGRQEVLDGRRHEGHAGQQGARRSRRRRAPRSSTPTSCTRPTSSSSTT